MTSPETTNIRLIILAPGNCLPFNFKLSLRELPYLAGNVLVRLRSGYGIPARLLKRAWESKLGFIWMLYRCLQKISVETVFATTTPHFQRLITRKTMDRPWSCLEQAG